MTTTDSIEQTVAGLTLPKAFLATVGKHGSSTALRWKVGEDFQSMNYDQYAEKVARATAGLKALGLMPGQRVVLMMRNIAEFHVIDMAICFCGATPVSIYNSSSPEQIQYLAEHCEASLAIVEAGEFYNRFAQVRGKLPGVKKIGVVGGQAPTDGFSYEGLLESDAIDLQTCIEHSKPEDLATLIYTSGTTGPPKGVMITHRNVMHQLEALRRRFSEAPDFDGQLAGLRMVSYLPMAHIAERNVSYYTAIYHGCEVTTCPDPTAILSYLQPVKPQVFFGVPRVWEKMYAGVKSALAADPEKAQKIQEAVTAGGPIAEKIDWGKASDEEKATYAFLDEVAFKTIRGLLGLDECKFAITGAAPIVPEMLGWFRAIGVPLTEIYGMSETTGGMTWASTRVKPGTVGRALEGIEVKLADDGEIICKGGPIFQGYLKAEEQTAEALDADGWLHSGDIGELDDEGYFKIVDRKKELIITAGGKNISPANLESQLKMIPLVGQACAIGDRRPFVSALLVLDPDVAKAWAAQHGVEANLQALAEDERVLAAINEGLAEAMAGFNSAERVKKVRVLGVEWLPDSEELTPTSKLKRREIMKKYADEIEGLYA
ncbi:MAG: long-chain fatty acid--CoA ligase [Myxococcales bacterium]|nr:long-chain fatty acid--CoA ligase [Myxococcales bacterium]